MGLGFGLGFGLGLGLGLGVGLGLGLGWPGRLLRGRARIAGAPVAAHRLHVRLVEFLLMHPYEVEGDRRRLAQQPARPRLPVAVVVTVIVASVVAVVWRWLPAASGAAHLRHAAIQLAQVAGPVGLDPASSTTARWRAGAPRPGAAPAGCTGRARPTGKRRGSGRPAGSGRHLGRHQTPTSSTGWPTSARTGPAAQIWGR